MILQHITKAENVPSIIIKGILPNYKKGLSSDIQNYVFLTNDFKRIIKTMAGKNWSEEIAVISVNVSQIKPYFYTAFDPPIQSNFEFITEKVTPSEIIGIDLLNYHQVSNL